MTAQVAILNKLAVAIASDSSVTLSLGDRRRRTFPSADKVHALPHPHLLAVMHSGNTELLGVPYGVLMGEWFSALPEQRLERVVDYAEHWHSWVNHKIGLFPRDTQDDLLEWMLRDYYLSVRSQLIRVLKSRELSDEPWDSLDVAAVVGEVTAERLKALRQRDRLPDWTSESAADYLADRSARTSAALEFVFDDVPRTVGGDAALREIAAEVVASDEPFSRDATLVFVGFGDDELFPAEQVIECRGVLNDQVRILSWDYTAISNSCGSVITPFGQTEAVNTFLRAYNSTFRSVAHDRLETALNELAELIPSDNEDAERIEAIRKQQQSELGDDFDRASWDQYLTPMLDTVEGLPPPELARMAESLVGLQVLRQLTQAEMETVGGPIDVAVIERDCGLTWIRNKSMPR